VTVRPFEVEFVKFHSLIRTSGYAEGRLHLGNKNKFEFILYFARFALPLRQASKVLSLGKLQINLHFHSLIRTFAGEKDNHGTRKEKKMALSVGTGAYRT
jgi:hypothetical protein